MSLSYGYIVLANSKKGFVPQSIKFFTGSKFSHSFITIPSILSIPMCIEAAEGGVDTVRFDEAYINNPDQGYEVWEIKLPEKETIDQAIIKLLSELEIKYNFLAYPWFVWRKINALFGKDIKNQDNWFWKDGLICSQLCVNFIKFVGLTEILKEYGEGSIAPQDLRSIFVKYPQYFVLKESVRMT